MTHVILIGNTVHHWCGNLVKDNSKERESLHRKELETSYQSFILVKFPTIHGENLFWKFLGGNADEGFSNFVTKNSFF